MFGSTQSFEVDAPFDVLYRFQENPVSGPMRSEKDEYAARLIQSMLETNRDAHVLPHVELGSNKEYKISVVTPTDSMMLEVLHNVVWAEMRGN